MYSGVRAFVCDLAFCLFVFLFCDRSQWIDSKVHQAEDRQNPHKKTGKKSFNHLRIRITMIVKPTWRNRCTTRRVETVHYCNNCFPKGFMVPHVIPNNKDMAYDQPYPLNHVYYLHELICPLCVHVIFMNKCVHVGTCMHVCAHLSLCCCFFMLKNCFTPL